MFSGCSGLTTLDVSKFITANVTNMGGMFSGCSSLTSLDLSKFNTAKVNDMAGMFYGCSSLTTLDISKFNTANVTNMVWMFYGCSKLAKLTLGSKFSTKEELECTNVFYNCGNLKTVAFTGDIPASIHSQFFTGVGTASSPATLDVPEQYKSNYAAKFNGNMFFGGYFTLGGQGIDPQDEDGGRDYGDGEIDETTDLDGNVIGNVYYVISPDNGGYNAAEGCIVVTQPSSDYDFEDEDPFGDEFKGMFTGIIFMVQPGSGTVKVEAETEGSMSLMVKIGHNSPIKMTLQSRSTLVIPYSVDKPTYIYIYAGDANATRAIVENALKIYSIGWEILESGIGSVMPDGQPFDVYSLGGTLVKRGVTSLKELSRGVYIVKGHKVVVK